MNRLVNVTDVIDFGSQKGEQFFWVYRMHISYLEWLINETQYCFPDLSDFYKFGKIKRFNKANLSKDKENLIIKEINKNPVLEKAPNTRLMTIQNIHNLISDGHITANDFVEVDYLFSEDLINKNAEKLKDAKPYHAFNDRFKKVYEHNFFYESLI